jgi:hypothetical protein
MGEPQRADAVESDRRSFPRFPAELLGKASVRLLGGSEVTLINFSERGILFQSETRLLVGARGTVRITIGGDTTIAAGTVVRSLVQGMASGKLAFHTALALDQPLPLAAAVAERERAKLAAAPPPAPPAAQPAAPPVDDVPAAPDPVVDAPAAPEPPSGKTIEKRSHKGAKEKGARQAAEAPVAPPAPEPLAAPAVPPAPPEPPAALEAAPPPPVDAGAGFSVGFDGASFGWDEPAADAAAAGLSVLFVSTTLERTARMQGILADHRDIVLTAIVHSKADALADVARQHDVLLFDFAIGPDALARTLAALRSSPLGASIAIFVPRQTALPPAVSSLANACVIDTTSGDQLAVALRDAAWTPWQPVETSAGAPTASEDLFWKAFDALPVPVLVVGTAGIIVRANDACARLAGGGPIEGEPLASLFAAADSEAIARLIADGLAGGHDDAPVFTATAVGAPAPVMLQALSVLPGTLGPELALRCELRTEPAEAPAPEPAPAGPDLAAEVATLTESLAAARAELRDTIETAEREHGATRDELDAVRLQLHAARRERDELQGRLEIAERDLAQSREVEQAGAVRIGELERIVAEAARTEVALARAQSQLAASTEEIGTLRNELDALRTRATSQGADSERAAARLSTLESSARQAIVELKAARADALRLTRERDKALAAAEAERARAEAAIAAAREDGKKGRKLVAEDPAPAAMLKLQRQLEEVRAELKQEQDARKELEELLDQNAANLEQTIQEYEERLEAMAGADDRRAAKPKKSLRG